MHLHFLMRHDVGRVAILENQPGREPLRLGDAGRLGSEQRHIWQVRRCARQPHLGAPGPDPAFGIERALEREQLRRPLRIPPVLVLTHPLHADRTADRAREQCRIGRGVIMAVHAVTTGAVEIDQAHAGLRQTEEGGEGLAKLVRGLRSRPDRRLAFAHVGDCARRPHRAVCLQRPVIFGGQALGRGGELLPRIPLAHQKFLGVKRAATHPLPHALMADQRVRLRPSRLEQPRGLYRVPFIVGDHTQEAFDAHDARARNALDRGCVDLQQFRTNRRRTYRAAVQHAVDRKVVHEDVTARDLRRHVGSRQGLADRHIPGRILQCRLGIDLHAEALVTDERADRDAGSSRFRTDHAFRGLELGLWPAALLRSHPDQCFARGRGRLPDLHAAAHDAAAASRRALIRRQRRVAFDHGDAIDGDTEFFGRHLANGDAQALAQIDLAAIERHRAVGMHGEKAVELARVECLAERSIGARDALRGSAAGETHADHQRAAGLEEFAPGKLRAHAGLLPAARITARRMRWCVPQRQRLPASAALASSIVAFGFAARRPTAVITMPLVQ